MISAGVLTLIARTALGNRVFPYRWVELGPADVAAQLRT